MRKSRLVCVALSLAALWSCGARENAGPPPLYGNLGSHSRKVTTSVPEAQAYFDQGLNLYLGFNHEEAVRAFEHAAVLDPACAMAYWGKAMTLGPHINNPGMDEASSIAAYEAAQQALERVAGTATPAERSLIAAVAKRYASPPPADRRSLDVAYAEAMREAWRAHPDDADIGALFAESLMDLRPWDLWTQDGKPQPETPEILATLDRVLAINLKHPGANHFYIHACEASPDPGRALAAADRLRDLVPGAGHLVHMPSHIDIRVGHYDEAVKANQRAIAADLEYVKNTGRKGFYTVYRAHAYHFLAYAAMFEGRKELAMQAARDMVKEVPLDVVRQLPDFLDAFIAVPIHVMVRFGMWEEILKEPQPPDDLHVTTATWRYGRTVALASLGRVAEATKEFSRFEEAYGAVPESALVGNNTARGVLDIARPMAEGELEYRNGNYERAFELLREAVRRDDALKYDEPWGWMQPVRHALGALLLEQGRIAAAEEAYREDLRLHPGNGWALLGLAECLRKSQKGPEAATVEAQLATAWARSDVKPKVSCYCRTKVTA